MKVDITEITDISIMMTCNMVSEGSEEDSCRFSRDVASQKTVTLSQRSTDRLFSLVSLGA